MSLTMETEVLWTHYAMLVVATMASSRDDREQNAGHRGTMQPALVLSGYRKIIIAE